MVPQPASGKSNNWKDIIVTSTLCRHTDVHEAFGPPSSPTVYLLETVLSQGNEKTKRLAGQPRSSSS